MGRRLVALRAADTVGYSRRTAPDDEGTLARLEAHRQALIESKRPRAGDARSGWWAAA